MTYFDIAIEIQAPPDRVSAVLLDVERWPEWTATVTSLRRIGRGPFSVGSRVRIRQPKLLPAIWQVTKLDAAKGLFTWVTHRPGLAITASHLVEGAGAGTRATLSIAYSGIFGSLAARFTRGLSERYIAIEANGLKARSEA